MCVTVVLSSAYEQCGFSSAFFDNRGSATRKNLSKVQQIISAFLREHNTQKGS